jgi:zinc transport system permease protein
MIDALSYGFVRDAIIVGLLAALVCGVVGTFVVVKRLVFLAGSLSHAAFGGLGLCYWLGVEPRVGAVAVTVLASLLLGQSDRDRLRTQDATIGVLWAVGMAVGIAFLYKSPGYAPDLTSFLFGSVLTVTRSDVLVAAGLAVVVLGTIALFFKELVAVAFDESYAVVQGIPVRRIMTLLMVMIGICVVMLIQVVGIILVLALLTIPPLIALGLARRLLSVLMVSAATGMAITAAGLALSFRYDLPSGPAIILVGTVLLLAVNLAKRGRRGGMARRSAA